MLNVLFVKIVEYVRFLFTLVSALKRDVKGIVAFKNILKIIDNHKDSTVADIFFNSVRKHPNKACIIFENKIWTYQDVRENFFIFNL